MAVALSRYDLPVLLDKLSNWFPNSLPIHNALQNIANCATDNSEIWVDAWPEVHGVFVFPSNDEQGITTVDIERRLFATDAKIAKNLLEKLNPLDGHERIILTSVREFLWPVVGDYAKSKSYRTETYCKAFLLYLPETTPLPENLELPDGFTVGCLQPKHGPVINRVYKPNVEDAYMTGLIQSFPSVAVYDQLSGNLAAWVISYEDGSLGHLYVYEPYRRRGLASFIVIELARIRRRMGKVPFLGVEQENKISMKLHIKLGFVLADEVLQWITCIRN